MRRYSKSLIVWLFSLLLLSCAKAPETGSARLRIVTSIYPLRDIVRHIAGTETEVFHLIPAGANPHDYDPPPSIVRQLQNVNLFVGVHPDFDGWIEDLLPSQTSSLYLHLESGMPGQIRSDHVRDFNPHFWLSVRTVREVIHGLADALCSMDSAHCQSCFDHLRDYQSRLDSLDQEITDQLHPFQGRALIQWHPAWDGFASDYQLKIAGTLEYGHGDTLPLQSFHETIQIARRAGVRLVIIGLNVESDAVKTFVRELDGRLLRLDTIGGPDKPDRNTYIRLMSNNARLLAQALGEQ